MYENALCIELAKQGLGVKQQAPIKVTYEGEVVGDYYADLLVEEKVLVELKAVQTLSKAHEVQLVNYLTATGIDIGLLLNFGPSRSSENTGNTSLGRGIRSVERAGLLTLYKNHVNPVNPVQNPQRGE